MRCAVTLLIGSILASTLHANGTRLPTQDATAIGRGYAVTASIDSPSAVYYNPSALTRIKAPTVSSFAYFLKTDLEFAGSAPGTAANADDDFLLPSLFVALPLGDGNPWTLGFGAYAPFGTSTNWAPSSGFSTIATFNELKFRRYALAAAYEVFPEFAIGASVQYNDVNANLHRAIGLAPNDDFAFNGDGDDWSFNFGITYRPTPRLTIGAIYQSKAEPTLDGTVTLTPFNFSETATADWLFPSNFAVGVEYQLTDAWTVEADIDWTDWSSLDAVVLQRSVSGPLVVPFGWEDSAYYGIGTSYTRDAWKFSLGYNYSENSVPTAAWNPAVPDFNRSLYSAGVTWRGPRLSLQAAFHFSNESERTISGTPASPAGQTANGRYRSQVFGLGIQGEFKW